MPLVPQNSLGAYMLWLVGAVFYMYVNLLTVCLGVLSPQISSYYSLQPTDSGFLASVYFIAYATMQIPVGWLLDRYSLKYCMFYSAIMTTLGVVVFALAPNYPVLLCGRTLTGIGASFAALSALNISAVCFSKNYFASLTGFLLTLGSVGAILGQFPLSLVLQHFGYNLCLLGIMVCGFIISMLIFFIIPYKAQQKLSNQKKVNYRTVLLDANVWYVMAYGSLMYSPYLILQSVWGIPFLEEAQNMTSPQAAYILQYLMLGFLLGGPMLGMLSEKFKDKKIFLILCALLTTFLLILTICVSGHNASTIALLLCMLGFISSGFLVSFDVLKQAVPTPALSLTMGIMNTVNTLGGVTLPPLIGYSIAWHISVHSLTPYAKSLAILPLITLCATILGFFIKENKERL